MLDFSFVCVCVRMCVRMFVFPFFMFLSIRGWTRLAFPWAALCSQHQAGMQSHQELTVKAPRPCFRRR